MLSTSADYKFQLDNMFFADIDAPEVQKGKVEVALTVKRAAGAFELTFRIDGIVWIPCDRCLDEMELPISSMDKLLVKLGNSYAEEDEMVVVPEEEGDINVAWFMYEFIALNIPIKHVHATGKCNKRMIGVLNKHLRTTHDDEENVDLSDGENEEVQVDHSVDPRWNELKKLIDNN